MAADAPIALPGEQMRLLRGDDEADGMDIFGFGDGCVSVCGRACA